MSSFGSKEQTVRFPSCLGSNVRRIQLLEIPEKEPGVAESRGYLTAEAEMPLLFAYPP